MSDAATARTYGMLAEFDNSDDLMWAARRAVDEGYRHLDAYSPYPVHGLNEIIGFQDARIGWIVFLGGLVGAISGFLLQVWVNLYAYPMNVGGRPMFSWPSFIPVTFECTILFAAGGAVVGMFLLNGLPAPYHPVFSAKNFDRVMDDRFFLAIEASDPHYDSEKTREFLESLRPQSISEVEERR